MKTKDKIIEEALNLFSINGYDGVSVRDIANAVGIKESSLYKHFSNKQHIYDEIIKTMKEKMLNAQLSLALPIDSNQQAVDFYKHVSLSMLQNIGLSLFEFYANDNYAKKFRQMLTIEQYKSSSAATVMKEIFLYASLEYQTQLFQDFIDQNIFIGENAEIIAYHFYGPIFLMLYQNDHGEVIKEKLLAHIQHFYLCYIKET